MKFSGEKLTFKVVFVFCHKNSQVVSGRVFRWRITGYVLQMHYFACSNYEKDYRGNCKTRHYIREDALEYVVMQELRRMVTYLRHDEERFVRILAKKAEGDLKQKKRLAEKELSTVISRNETVERLYEKLYEDNAEGKISDEWYAHMSRKYELERIELKAKRLALTEQLNSIENEASGIERFIFAVRRFMDMDKLTAPLLHELIDHIEIHETQGRGKNRIQRIVIYYKFVGYIELDDAVFQEVYQAQTREGVAVNYLTVRIKDQASSIAAGMA